MADACASRETATIADIDTRRHGEATSSRSFWRRRRESLVLNSEHKILITSYYAARERRRAWKDEICLRLNLRASERERESGWVARLTSSVISAVQ